MDLDTFIIAVFCLVDEAIPQLTGGHRLRERGPEPILADSEVLTMEVVGEYLGLAQDTTLFAYFRQRYAHFFPALLHLHCTTIVRQAANLWRVKERLWARDLWHLSKRLLRKVLMHTLAILFNVDPGNPPLQLARMVAS